MAPPILAQSEERANRFDRYADSLRFAQNSDGGWGPLAAPPGEDPRTTRDPGTLRLSSWASFVLLDLGADPSWSWPNREGVPVSLANSTVSNGLDWLHRAEAEAAPAAFGDAALLAAVYARLGDDVNAERIGDDLVRVQAENGSWGGVAETAQSVFALSTSIRAEGEGPQAARLAEALEAAVGFIRAANASAGSGDDLAWTTLALAARGHSDTAAFAEELASRSLGSAPDETVAAAAWALAATGHRPEADPLLAQLDARPVGGVGRVLAIEAMAARHPSLLEDERERLQSIAVSAGAGGSFDAITPASLLARLERDVAEARAANADAEAERDALAARERRLLESESGQFPLPSGFVASTSLVFLAALTIFGLAIGLHRETLGGQRKAIFDYIEGRPGEHLNQIRRDLGISPGAVMYHLHALEKGGWITSHRDARYKRFYVNGNRVQQLLQGRDYKEKHAALKNETARALIQFVRDHPGVGQKAVSESLGLHPSTVNWHVNRLKEAGLLVDQKVGRSVQYNVADASGVDKVLKRLREAPPTGEGTAEDIAS